jgi:hypothetical protein
MHLPLTVKAFLIIFKSNTKAKQLKFKYLQFLGTILIKIENKTNLKLNQFVFFKASNDLNSFSQKQNITNFFFFFGFNMT